MLAGEPGEWPPGLPVQVGGLQQKKIRQCDHCRIFIRQTGLYPWLNSPNGRLSANEVDMSQFRLERVTLYRLNFDFGFFTVDDQ